MGVNCLLAQLHDAQPVRLGAVADRFLAAGQGLGDRADAHALAGELMELLDLVLPPRLAVPLELLAARHWSASLCSPAKTGGSRPLQRSGSRCPGPRPSPGSRYLTRSTCSNSSSTGVARPKMETLTLTRPRSKSSSSTTPLKVANGPSSTFTASPIS